MILRRKGARVHDFSILKNAGLSSVSFISLYAFFTLLFFPSNLNFSNYQDMELLAQRYNEEARQQQQLAEAKRAAAAALEAAHTA